MDGRSRAHKRLDEGRQKIAEKQARREDLIKRLEKAASEEEAKAMKMEIDTLEDQLQKVEKEVKDAEAEETKFNMELDEAENEDEYDEMEGVVEDVNNDPDIPQNSTESINPADFAAKLMKGLRISDRNEGIDLTRDVQLRNTQAVVCYKSGFGKPVIVVDCEFPEFIIYRIRKDIEVPVNCPNLMKWRRGGKVKDPITEAKWTAKDVSDVLDIAIEVPLGFDGKPENLVKLIQRLTLSEDEKEALRKKGKPIPKQPKQPDVQLLVQWKEGIIAPGETEARFTSWESRSSCRALWRKKGAADKFLLKVATNHEVGYRQAGGKHSSEERSLSPIVLPSAGSTPDPEDKPDSYVSGTEEEEDTEEEEEKKKKKKKKREKKEEEKKEEEKKEVEKKEEKTAFDASDYKAASDEYELKWRARKGIAADVELTPIQEADVIEGFEYIWAKRLAAKRAAKL